MRTIPYSWNDHIFFIRINSIIDLTEFIVEWTIFLLNILTAHNIVDLIIFICFQIKNSFELFSTKTFYFSSWLLCNMHVHHSDFHADQLLCRALYRMIYFMMAKPVIDPVNKYEWQILQLSLKTLGNSVNLPEKLLFI